MVTRLYEHYPLGYTGCCENLVRNVGFLCYWRFGDIDWRPTQWHVDGLPLLALLTRTSAKTASIPSFLKIGLNASVPPSVTNPQGIQKQCLDHLIIPPRPEIDMNMESTNKYWSSGTSRNVGNSHVHVGEIVNSIVIRELYWEAIFFVRFIRFAGPVWFVW